MEAIQTEGRWRKKSVFGRPTNRLLNAMRKRFVMHVLVEKAAPVKGDGGGATSY